MLPVDFSWNGRVNASCNLAITSPFLRAKIALTRTPEDEASVYVIFLGVEGNSESAIRYGIGGFDLARADTPNLLSADETR